MTTNSQAWLWHQLAEEARAAAKQIKDQELKRQVLLIAARYVVMAKWAEKAVESKEQHPTE